MDATGKLVGAVDDGGSLSYTYDSWGNLLTVKRETTTLVSNTYDTYGRQTHLNATGAGVTQYAYNAFGLLTWQQNANNQQTTLAYDNLGRLKSRTEPEGTRTWTYFYQGGKFNDNVVSDGTNTFTYNASGLMETGYSRTYAYDQYARVSGIQINSSPMQVQLNYNYTAEGYLSTITSGATTLFGGLSMNGMGRYKSYVLADGKTTTVTYDQQYPTRIQATGVQDLNMAYDYSTGNLSHRWDKVKARKENFQYDALDRLTRAQVDQVNSSGAVLSTVATNNYNYDGAVGSATMGNLVMRTDIGKFGHNNVHRVGTATGHQFPFPHNDPPLAINTGTQSITYTSFHQPSVLTETVGGSPYKLEYTYDSGHQRNYSKRTDITIPNDPPLEERWYENGLETQQFDGDASTSQKVLYVQGGDGLCAMIVANGGGQTIYSVYKDHLGSIVAATKKVGATVTVVAEQNFDPWGRRRNATNWTYSGIASVPNWLYRGYTGHEHLEPFALINMNGRLYDPLNGRMLSADNYTHETIGTQGYNRFSYAANNPVKYTDPDGEHPIIIAAAVGGLLNWAFNGAEVSGNGLLHFAIGAGAGALGAGVGLGVSSALAKGGFIAGVMGTSSVSATGFGAGALSGASAGGAAGFFSGTGNSLLSGSSTRVALQAGLREGGMGVLTGGVIGGVVGGIQSVKHGGGFFERGSISTVRVERELGRVRQVGDMNCLCAAGESIDPTLSQSYIRSEIGGDPMLDPIDNLDFGQAFGEMRGRYFGIRGSGTYTSRNVFNDFSAGADVVFSTPVQNGMSHHATVLRSATQVTSTFARSQGQQLFRFSVMDPSIGGFRRFTLDTQLSHYLQWR